MAYRDVVLADSPLDFYEMETSTGTDSGSANKTLTLAGGITTGVAGKFGNGWSFDGVNDSASIAAFPSLSNAFTFEAWVKAPSAQGMTGDYHTIIRRDGTDIGLLRVRGSNITGNVNPGQAEVYIDGTILLSGASYRVDDGNWHHLVYTQAGNAAKLYVDGQLRASATTSQSTFNMGTGTGYVGSAGGTSEYFKGTMDSVAIYNTALSATRITAHYDAGNTSGVTIDLDTPTVSLNVTDGTYEGRNGSYVAPVITEDGTKVTDSGGNVTWSSTAATASVQYSATGGNEAYFRFDQSAIAGGSIININKATLKVRVQNIGSSGSAEIQPYGKPSATKTFWASGTPVGYEHTFDVTGAITTVSGSIKQILLTSTSGTAKVWFHSTESGTVDARPLLEIEYTTPAINTTVDAVAPAVTTAAYDPEVVTVKNVDVTAESATLSLSVSEATVGTGTSVEVTTEAATIAVTAYDATVETVVDPNLTVDADTPYITANAYDPTVVIPVAVDVDMPTATVAAHEPEVDVRYNMRVDVDTPSVRLKATRLESVNNELVLPSESEDPYFTSTMRTINGQKGEDSFWFRLNETSGDKAWDRTNANEPDMYKAPSTYSNVQIGRNDGPNGRHSVYFNGAAWIAQWEANVWGTNGSGDEQFYSPTSLEFSFRTTRGTQFLMGGQDVEAQHNWPERRQTSPYELWLVDGQLEIRLLSMGFTNQVVQRLTVPGVLNDGKWHHIVHQKAHGGSYEGGTPSYFSVEVYVDGDLAIRRRIGTMPLGMPEYIGGRPNGYEFGTTVDDLATSHWFLGDMTEVIFRNGRSLTEDEVHAQRDAIFGIEAIRPEAARITQDAYDPIVKGNKPRVLVLQFTSHTHWAERKSTFSVPNQAKVTAEKHYLHNQSNSMINAQTSGLFETDFIGWGEVGPVFNATISNDFIAFTHNISGNAAGQTYRDPLTDNLRLIDLEKDLNMDDFDIISIIGFPRNAYMWQAIEMMDDANIHPMVPARQQVANLMDQIKDQVINHRKSLMITDPFSAIALGIIDKAEYVPNFKERAYFDSRLGAQTGDFDWHSAVIDPFNGANPEQLEALQRNYRDPLKFRTNLQGASRYEDTHANLRQRLRYGVEGLTDIPSWIQTDEIKWWNLNPMGNPPYELSRAYEQKPFGLTVGQEFYMQGGRGEPWWAEHPGPILERMNGWVATPGNAVKVGHAVTTFAQQFHSLTVEHPDEIGPNDVNFDTVIGNPYGDHAISIAVVPGDLWDGQYVTGKVYVNYTESFTWWADLQKYDQIMKMRSRFPDLKDADTIGIGDQFSYPDGRTWTVNQFHLKYQFSTHYGSHSGSQVALPQTGGSGADWGWSPGGVRGTAGSGGLGAGEAMQWRWRYNAPMETIYVPTMANRAVKWLAKDVDTAGNANVAVQSATLSAKANDVTVEVVSNVDVTVPSARFNLEAHNDQSTDAPNVSVLVGTPTVSMRASGLTQEVVLDTPTVTLRAVDPEPEEYKVDWSEAIIMTLPRSVETLILEDNS